MATPQLDEQIAIIVKDEINQLPTPMRCTILKIYDDNFHVDVETENGVLRYVETIGSNLMVGDLGLVLFLENSFNDYVILTK